MSALFARPRRLIPGCRVSSRRTCYKCGAKVARVERQRNPGRRCRIDRMLPDFAFAQSALRPWPKPRPTGHTKRLARNAPFPLEGAGRPPELNATFTVFATLVAHAEG